RSEIRKLLGSVLDLERLLAKLTLGTAGPRELMALGRSLEIVPKLKERASAFESARLKGISSALDEIPELRDRILAAIADEPPPNLSDGGTIRGGFHYAGIEGTREQDSGRRG